MFCKFLNKKYFLRKQLDFTFSVCFRSVFHIVISWKLQIIDENQENEHILLFFTCTKFQMTHVHFTFFLLGKCSYLMLFPWSEKICFKHMMKKCSMKSWVKKSSIIELHFNFKTLFPLKNNWFKCEKFHFHFLIVYVLISILIKVETQWWIA